MKESKDFIQVDGVKISIGDIFHFNNIFRHSLSLHLYLQLPYFLLLVYCFLFYTIIIIVCSVT